MADFDITLENGKSYTVTAPDVQTAYNALMSMIKSQPPTGPMAPPRADDWATKSTPKSNRFGDVTGEATQQPWEAAKAYGRSVIDPNINITAEKLPEWLPQPVRSATGLLGDIGMTGLTTLGTGLSGAAGAIAEVFAGDKTQERKLARDLMMGMEVAVPELAGVSSSAVGMGRKAAMGSIPLQASQAAQAAQRLGVVPSAAMTGRGPALIASALESTPFSAGRMAGETERVVGQMSDISRKAAERIGMPTTIPAAGEAARTGAQQFVSNFQNKASLLYDEVDKYIPKTIQVRAPNTANALSEIVDVYKSTPDLAQADIAAFAKYRDVFNVDALARGNVPYAVLKDFRTQIGRAIGDMKGPFANFTEARLKKIYGALTEDMGAVANSQGPQAAKAFSRANTYYKAGNDRIKNTLTKVLNADTPEKAYNNIQGMLLEESPRSSIAALNGIKKSLPLDEFNQVSATIFDRLGRARAGAQDATGELFSPATFLTNWNKMSPSARRILVADKEVYSQLNDLAKIASTYKDALKERNVSRTGGTVGTLAAASTFGGGIATLNVPLMAGVAAAGAGLNISSRAMTNPTFLKALNKAAANDVSMLRQMALRGGEFSAEAQTLLRTMGAGQATGPQ